MNLGDSFIIQFADTSPRLWVIASGQNDDEHVAMFKLIDWKPRVCDEACIVEPSEHEFLIRRSVVDYQYGRSLYQERLDEMNRIGCSQSVQPVSRDLLIKIQQGALESLFTPQKYQKMVQDSLVS